LDPSSSLKKFLPTPLDAARNNERDKNYSESIFNTGSTIAHIMLMTWYFTFPTISTFNLRSGLKPGMAFHLAFYLK